MMEYRLQDLLYMLPDVGGNFFDRQVVGINTKGIFNFLRNQFHTGRNIKNKDNHRYGIISQTKDISEREGHNITENESLYKGAIGIGYGSVRYTLAGTTYIRTGLCAAAQNDKLA